MKEEKGCGCPHEILILLDPEVTPIGYLIIQPAIPVPAVASHQILGSRVAESRGGCTPVTLGLRMHQWRDLYVHKNTFQLVVTEET